MGEVSYKGHRYPAEIIAHCVWLYHRFPLSFRELEELLLVRGMIVSYETIVISVDVPAALPPASALTSPRAGVK